MHSMLSVACCMRAGMRRSGTFARSGSMGRAGSGMDRATSSGALPPSIPEEERAPL